MANPLPKLATIGEIANQLNAPLHRIEYILRTRPHIKARAIAASARCFGDQAIAEIRHELHTIDARRQEVVR